MSDKMTAYTLFDFEQPARIAELDVPRPGPREVRVRVLASSVNPVDAAIERGFFRSMYEYRLPAALGRDFAGVIDAVGKDVTDYAEGDDVFGMVKRDYIGDGTFAEFVVVDPDRFLVRRSADVPVDAAGAMGLAGVTALQCIDALGLPQSSSVFINGASGGVGSFAIQIAVARGLKVVATARPGDEEAHVRHLGATQTVDWSVGNATDSVKRLHPEGVGGAVDLISRNTESFLSIASAVAAGGSAVTTLSAAPAEAPSDKTLRNVHSDSDPGLLTELQRLVASGSVKVPLLASFPFEKIADAFALLATGPNGKVGLTFSA